MSLRIAFNTNGASNHRLDDALTLIAEAGYDGVALTLDHHHLDPFADSWIADAEALARRLAALKLGSVIETGARFLLDPRAKHEPTLVSAEGRDRRIAFLERAIEIAAILGSETVSFWSGVVKPGVSEADARNWLDAGLAEVCATGARHGVALSFEPEPGMLIETAEDYSPLAERHPSLRLALDTGHCLVTGEIEPAAAVRRFADRLGTVAIEDMKRGVHEHLPFGQGDMDVHLVLDALRDIGFNRLICIELSRESHRAQDAIPEALDYIKGIG